MLSLRYFLQLHHLLFLPGQRHNAVAIMILAFTWLCTVNTAKAGRDQDFRRNFAADTASVPATKKAAYYNSLAWRMRHKEPEVTHVYVELALEYALAYNQARNQVYSYNTHGLYHHYKGEGDSAIYYFELVIEQATQHNLPQFRAYGYQNAGNHHFELSDFDKALQYYSTAGSIFTETDQSLDRAIILNNIGLIHSRKGRHSDALDSFLEAYRIYQDSLTVRRGFGALLNNIADVYNRIHNYEQAYNFYRQGIYVNSTVMPSDRRLGNSYRKIARSLIVQERYQEAADYLDSALVITNRLDDPGALAKCYRIKASLLLAQKRYEEAELVLATSMDLTDPNDSTLLTAELLLISGRLHAALGRHQQAANDLEHARERAVQLGVRELMAQVYRELYNFYNAAGNPEKASLYAGKYHVLSDGLYKAGIVSTMNAQRKYEAERTQKEIAGMELQQAKLEKRAASRKFWLIISGFIILAVVALAVIRQRIQAARLKHLNQVNKMQDEVNHQKILALRKEQEIRSVRDRLDGEVQERKRLARELHDGIGGALGGLKLRLMNTAKHEPDVLSGMVDDIYQEVRTISHNLVPAAVREMPFTDLVSSCVAEVAAASGLEATVNCYPPGEANMLPELIRSELYRIIQELVSNVRKHADATELTLQVIVHDTYVNAMVEDNGRGFDADSATRGIGLVNTESRVKLLSGKMEIDSALGRGTVTTLDIPI